MSFIRDHEQSHSGQSSGKKITQIGVIIRTDGRLNFGLKEWNKGEHYQQNRQRNPQVAYRPPYPSISEIMIYIELSQLWNGWFVPLS